MATLINPSTGSQPRHSMQSRRSSRQLNRTSNVDMRASMSFGRHLNDVPQSPALGQDQQRGYSADVRRDASAPAIHTMSQDSHTKKLEAGDMTRSDSGFDDGFSDEERARLDRRVVWKTDLVMLPLMGCIVLLQYLDKAILSYAALLGLAIDLKLESNEYSWAGEFASASNGPMQWFVPVRPEFPILLAPRLEPRSARRGLVGLDLCACDRSLRACRCHACGPSAPLHGRGETGWWLPRPSWSLHGRGRVASSMRVTFAPRQFGRVNPQPRDSHSSCFRSDPIRRDQTN